VTQHPKDQRSRLRIVFQAFLILPIVAARSAWGWPAGVACAALGTAAIWWFTRNLPGPESEPARPEA